MGTNIFENWSYFEDVKHDEQTVVIAEETEEHYEERVFYNEAYERWLRKNISGEYAVFGHSEGWETRVWIKDEIDATAFKLRWM